MDRRFAVAQHEFYDDTMRLRLTDGDELTTSRMTVSDTTVVVYALKRRWRSDELDTPLVIRARDVESIEHVEIDWSNTVAAVLALELTVFATIILLGN